MKCDKNKNDDDHDDVDDDDQDSREVIYAGVKPIIIDS